MEVRKQTSEGVTILTIDEDVIRCNAAHYIGGHDKCGCIHGHTYFIEGMEIVCDYEALKDRDIPLPYLDFGMLKKLIKDLYDHKFIVPERDAAFWRNVYLRAIESGIQLSNSGNIQPIPYDLATCENMADYLKQKIMSLPGVMDVTFELREGPSQGVIV